jgi:hypothetical protein
VIGTVSQADRAAAEPVEVEVEVARWPRVPQGPGPSPFRTAMSTISPHATYHGSPLQKWSPYNPRLGPQPVDKTPDFRALPYSWKFFANAKLRGCHERRAPRTPWWFTIVVPSSRRAAPTLSKIDEHLLASRDRRGYRRSSVDGGVSDVHVPGVLP